jgi:hypothetical protein
MAILGLAPFILTATNMGIVHKFVGIFDNFNLM